MDFYYVDDVITSQRFETYEEACDHADELAACKVTDDITAAHAEGYEVNELFLFDEHRFYIIVTHRFADGCDVRFIGDPPEEEDYECFCDDNF